MVKLTLTIKGINDVDSEAHERLSSVPFAQDERCVKLLQTTATGDAELSKQVAVSPNPATESAVLFTGDLDVEQIEAVNALGQVLHVVQPSGSRTTRLDLSGWQEGIYTLRIHTKQGSYEKRLLVR